MSSGTATKGAELKKKKITTGSPYLRLVPKKLKVLLHLDNELTVPSVIMIIFKFDPLHNVDNLLTGTFATEIQKSINRLGISLSNRTPV
jgi:hypothetical protein